ncbi:hypothetical protein [Caballeronia mineralivorans]|jgi:hypothetical protein|uniref:hypothetical protein n=1 Tax=Caballeronia mineralivorans TaxID=2010198 RepID=UPI0023F1BE11|nr:hypothetical protein [Caballeronia mineralivorans]MDB5788497.1 TetR family transcriptional regulator [Caballeronia mineralivorans]MEA3101190.1 hypothetical protein [Caballeronia mineralivorans]
MRRIPQQERAEHRIQDMLAAAGAVIAERSFDGIAEVLLQIVKSLAPLYKDAKPKERRLLVDEYKTVVTAYLTARVN